MGKGTRMAVPGEDPVLHHIMVEFARWQVMAGKLLFVTQTDPEASTEDRCHEAARLLGEYLVRLGTDQTENTAPLANTLVVEAAMFAAEDPEAASRLGVQSIGSQAEEFLRSVADGTGDSSWDD